MATQALTKYSRLTLELTTPARISLQNPPLNVIDIPMMEELGQAMAEIESRHDISVIVLKGMGKAFSAGVDVAAHTPDKVQSMLAKFHAVINVLVNTRKVTIAGVHGHCLGGGAELAMVCDLVYTTESAQWGFPEIKLGCYPPVACTALAALAVTKKAFYAWDSIHFDKGLARAGKIYLEELMQTEDAHEGVNAFLKK